MSLAIEGIWKGYGPRAVLRGLDLTVAPGEICGLLGPNGSGKSTAIQIVVGLLPPDRGRVTVGGQRAAGAPVTAGSRAGAGGPPTSDAVRGRLGFVPQEPALYPNLSCVETLRFFGRVYGVPRKDLSSRVEATVRSTGLGPYCNVRTRALSFGWRQRLSLAAALVHEPEFLVMDEPTTGLDAEVRYQVWDLIRSLADRGTAVLLASHSLEETDAFCHRIGILEGGRIAAEGSPQELRHLVPAAEMAEVEVPDTEGFLTRAREHGWEVRRRGSRWLLLLEDRTTLPDLAGKLCGLPLRSLSLRPVNLEDVFLEITREARGAGETRPGRKEEPPPPGFRHGPGHGPGPGSPAGLPAVPSSVLLVESAGPGDPP